MSFFELGDGTGRLFDSWPEKYDRWFTTPLGRLVKDYEGELVLDLLRPRGGELILDAGCGTGVFTLDILRAGARVVGIDISLPMVRRGQKKAVNLPFHPVRADMMFLPFGGETFDKTVSITAVEFIEDLAGAVGELFRVTKPGGYVVVATLNSLSVWAERRKAKAREGRSAVFERAIFRSPDELQESAPVKGIIKTAVHFRSDEDPARAMEIEENGRLRGLNTGAFMIARWTKK
jgi:ubiquinone/menaquinone biosynthesis C-methylase UbiE